MNKNVWIGGLLFLSLALNLFLGGLILGREVKPSPERRFQALKEHIKTLPPEERRAAQSIIQSYRPQLQEQLQSLRKQRKEAMRRLKDGTYSRAEAEEEFRRIREQAAQIQASAQKMVLDILDEVAPEKRAEFLRSQEMHLP